MWIACQMKCTQNKLILQDKQISNLIIQMVAIWASGRITAIWEKRSKMLASKRANADAVRTARP